MTKRSELHRLRREHKKAERLYRATHSPRHWKAMSRIVTQIVALTGKGARG